MQYNACSPICAPSCSTINFGGKLYSNGWIEGGECWNQIECFYCNASDGNRCYRRVIQAPARLLNNKSCSDIPSNIEMYNSCDNCQQEEECPDIKFEGKIYAGQKQQGSSDCVYNLKCYRCIDDNCEDVTLYKNQKEIRESCSDYSYENVVYYNNSSCNDACTPPCAANPMHVVIDGVCHCAPGLEGTPIESGGQGCSCPEINDPKITGGTYTNGHCEYEITCYECRNTEKSGCSEISGKWYAGWPTNCSGYNTAYRFFYDSDQDCQQNQGWCKKSCGENEIDCYGVCCDLNNNYCDVDTRECEENTCPEIKTGDEQVITGVRDAAPAGYANQASCDYTIDCWACIDGSCREVKATYENYTGAGPDIKCENNVIAGKQYYKDQSSCVANAENCEPSYECITLYDENYNGYEGTLNLLEKCGGVMANGVLLAEQDVGCCKYEIPCYECNKPADKITKDSTIGCQEVKYVFKYSDLTKKEDKGPEYILRPDNCPDKWKCTSDCTPTCPDIKDENGVIYPNIKNGVWFHQVRDCRYEITGCGVCTNETCLEDEYFTLLFSKIKWPEEGEDFCQQNGRAKIEEATTNGVTLNNCYYLNEDKCDSENACSKFQHSCGSNCCESNQYCVVENNKATCKTCPPKKIGKQIIYGKYKEQGQGQDLIQGCEYTFDCYECTKSLDDDEKKPESEPKATTQFIAVSVVENENLNCGIYSTTEDCTTNITTLKATCYACIDGNNNKQISKNREPDILNCQECNCQPLPTEATKIAEETWTTTTTDNVKTTFQNEPDKQSLCNNTGRYDTKEICEKTCARGGRLVNCCVRYSDKSTDCFIVKEDNCNSRYFDSFAPNFIFGPPPFVQITGLASPGKDGVPVEHSYWNQSKCKCPTENGACCYINCEDTTLKNCMDKIGEGANDNNETWKKEFFKLNEKCGDTDKPCEDLENECGKWECNWTRQKTTSIMYLDTVTLRNGNEERNRCPPGCFCNRPEGLKEKMKTDCKCGNPKNNAEIGQFLPEILIDPEIFK